MAQTEYDAGSLAAGPATRPGPLGKLGVGYAGLAAPDPPEHHFLARLTGTDMTATNEDGSPHGKAVLRELGPLHQELRRAIPAVYQGWGELSRAAFADGALDKKTKELIALAVAVVEGCDGCMASHGQAAARAGATPQEAAEAIGVTFLMHGGPATIHGARAFDAFCEFVDAFDAGETPA